MLKKISFLFAALLAIALMGCEQQKKPVQTAQTDEQMQTTGQAPAGSADEHKGGKIESGEHGAMTPSQEAPAAPAPEPKKAS